ncbi:MAG TPA: DUF4193 family protein [Actinomycetota bacterium]|nr:DUF4193 family protein [Actinomycetota bacterium]
MEEEEEEESSDEAVEEPNEASLEELIAKKGEDSGDEEPEDEPVIEPGREERVETLSVKVVPQQPTEFTCKNCFLVKHRSQLADKKRMFCVDCVAS